MKPADKAALKEGHAYLMGKANALNVEIAKLMQERDAYANLARELFDRAWDEDDAARLKKLCEEP